MNEENNWPTCKLPTFPFTMLKIMGVFFWGENFHRKRKSLTQLGSHIVIEPLDVALVFFSLHGLILITRAIQEKVFHKEAFNLCLPNIALSFGKGRIWTLLKLVGSFWDLELR
jgi:hypothetical protein